MCVPKTKVNRNDKSLILGRFFTFYSYNSL